MQRLFSTFPSTWPAAGLLLLCLAAGVSPWNGELRSQASAILLRILRKIVFTDRTEMPVMRRFVSPSDPTQNSEPDAGIALD